MPDASDYRKLLELLQELGVPAMNAGTSELGFPISVPLADGSHLELSLPGPGLLSSLDPEVVGVAILDPLGYARVTWGLARRVMHLQSRRSLLETPIAGLMEGALDGQGGSLYLDGLRYFAGRLGEGPGSETLILVLNAGEERQLRRQNSQATRSAETLRRLGKALTMNQTRYPMCVAAAHELASSLELAMVLIWALDPATEQLTLVANVGANRQATAALRVLGNDGTGCLAELVATSRRPFHIPSVLDHVLTANVEARCSYLKAGAVSIHPLIISDRLLGVLELVGREGDPYLEDHHELLQTVAEHLSLALNSATMFENFERWASHDALTGLANHRALQDFLHTRLAEAKRSEGSLGVLMMDVDYFRSFNEEEGHDAGDEVLRLVADALKSCVRPYDLAARYGGEEFCIVAPNSTRAGLMAMAERIRLRLSVSPYVTRSGRERTVTVSIGCAEFPAAGDDVASLLKAADRALYQAKRSGRDQAIYYDKKVGGHEPQGPDLDRLWAWVLPENREAARELCDRLEMYLDPLARAMRLTAAQAQILRALAVVAHAYDRAAQEDFERLQAMEESEDFRALLPSLRGLLKRYDRNGNRNIPLLARVLTVLMALEEDGGQPLLEDPGRFDPEVVAVVTDLYPAA